MSGSGTAAERSGLRARADSPAEGCRGSGLVQRTLLEPLTAGDLVEQGLALAATLPEPVAEDEPPELRTEG